jgi:hypothetical protein
LLLSPVAHHAVFAGPEVLPAQASAPETLEALLAI